MNATISTVHFFKRGLQPLLITSERDNGMGRFLVVAYLVWPERQEGGAEVEKLIEVSMPLNRGFDTEGRAKAADLMRLSAREAALHRAAKLAIAFPDPADDLQVAAVDLNKLRAWRSVGLFPGLANFNVIDSHTATSIVHLDAPFEFTVV